MRILVTGSRHWENDKIIAEVLSAFEGGSHTLVSGNCPTGADRMCEDYAAGRGWTVECHPADWHKYGKAAGPKRNQDMVDLGADVCLAFIRSGSSGATHCANRAERAGIKVKRYPL